VSPTFSIVIPCHNYARFLRTAIDSILAQHRDDIEVIVVDDASTDDTTTCAESYGDPVRLIRLEENLGPGGAWAVGLSATQGGYVCRLDADDWQLPGFLDRVESEFSRHHRIGLVATAVIVYQDGAVEGAIHSPTTTDKLLDERQLRSRFLRKYFVRMPGTAIRRAAIERHAAPRSDIRMGEDWEYLMRVLRGWGGSLVATPFAVNRLHGASLTATSTGEDRLRPELEQLLSATRDPGGISYLADAERRTFAVGVGESYLGTIGARLSPRELPSLVGHAVTATRLTATETPLAPAFVLRYLLWGAWQRLVVRGSRAQVPATSFVP
jgi:glycosyltransferase involved in cell wall biosynthesis